MSQEIREQKVYTFTQPVRGGHYYIAIRAFDDTEAAQKAIDIVKKIRKPLTDRLHSLSILSNSEERLVLPNLKKREALEKFGYIYTFHPVHYPLYHAGHKGYLPD